MSKAAFPSTDFDSSDSEEGIRGVPLSRYSPLNRPASSVISEDNTDPWNTYQEKLRKEIAKDSERLTRMRENSNPQQSGKSQSGSREEFTSIRDIGSPTSEIDLETEKFQLAPQGWLKQSSHSSISTVDRRGHEQRVEKLVQEYQRSRRVTLGGESVEGLRGIIEVLLGERAKGTGESGGDREKKMSVLTIGEEENLGVSASQSPSFTVAASVPTSPYSPYSPYSPHPTPHSLSAMLQVFSSYESQLLQLTSELENLKAKNRSLTAELAAIRDKQRVVEWAEQMQGKTKLLVDRLEMVAEENASLRTQIQAMERVGRRDGTGYEGESLNSLRKFLSLRLQDLAEPVPPLSSEELSTLQNLLDLHSTGDEKRFDDYLSSLLTKHDAGLLAGTMVRYIRWTEEEIVLRLRKEVVEQRVKGEVWEGMYEESVGERAKSDAEVSALKIALEELRRELERVTTRAQIELRRNQAEASLAASRSAGKMAKQAMLTHSNAGEGKTSVREEPGLRSSRPSHKPQSPRSSLSPFPSPRSQPKM